MKLFILVLLALSLRLSAQDPIEDKSGFSLGLVISPELSYRSYSLTTKGKEHDYLVNYGLPWRDSLESSKFSPSIGLAVLYNINKKVLIESGVYYANKGYKIDHMFITTQSGTTIREAKITYNYKYVDIPFKVNFNIIDKKVKLFLSGGVIANILINLNTRLEEEGWPAQENSSRDFSSPFNVSLVAGVGIDYDISNKIVLRLQPQYQRFITSADNSPSTDFLKEYLYSYSVNFGVFYKL